MPDTREKNPAIKARKFLFDGHCFDDGYVEVVEPEIPPPPTFSEEELAAAKKDSYERGRREAFVEAEASREKHIATLIGTIVQRFQTLFLSEEERNARYEAEAVSLAGAIFEKLFPMLNENHGIDEVTHTINLVLQKQRQNPEIFVEVHKEYADSIAQRLSVIKNNPGFFGTVTVRSCEDLGIGDCRMIWENGGATHSATALAQEIRNEIEHLLAGKAVLRDNGTKATGPSESANMVRNGENL